MRPPAYIGDAMPFARKSVNADGIQLSVVDVPGDSGETVMLLHGNPTWSFLWRKLIGPLAQDGHRVVAPDHAGHGLSDKPTDPAYYSLERHINNLSHVAQQLELHDVTLVLHDWGGPIGMGWAGRQPHRIKRIIIANSVAFTPRRQRPLSPFHAIFGSKPIVQAGYHLNLVGPIAMHFGVKHRIPRDARRAYAWPLKTRGGRTAVARMVQLVPNGPHHPTAATLAGIEANYQQLANKPIHIYWADGDPVFPPKMAQRWLRNFPQAEVEHVSRAGHFWQEDDPEPVLTRMRKLLAT